MATGMDGRLPAVETPQSSDKRTAIETVDLTDDIEEPFRPTKRPRHDALGSAAIRSSPELDFRCDTPSTPTPRRVSNGDLAAAGVNEPLTPPPTQSKAPPVPQSSSTLSMPKATNSNRCTNPQTPSKPPTTSVVAPTPLSNPVPPSTDKKALYSTPELAKRYIPQTSTLHGVTTRHPGHFALKPGHWQPWTAREYSIFASHLRVRFDPVPFACATGRTIEDVRAVFVALVVNPLYDAGEAARRGKEGVESLMRLFGEHGTQKRGWGKEAKVLGELEGVEKGKVCVIGEKWERVWLELRELSAEDVKYLKEMLVEEDREVLWVCEQGE